MNELDILEEVFEAYSKSDFVKAFALAISIAKQGSKEAQAFIGSAYQLGLGVPIDGKKAVEWYQKSANQGYGLAYHNLSCIYALGLPNIKPDVEKSDKYRKKAKMLGFNM